jgi:ATP-dependent DNA helicase RecG
MAVLPAKGLSSQDLEKAKKWIRRRCNTIDPAYQPVLSPETHEGVRILVVWIPASLVRPHQAPESAEKGTARKFYIRLGLETIDADSKPELKTGLIQLTARIPFDDRLALQATISDLRDAKVREFLNDIGSRLVNKPSTKTLYRALRIVDPVDDHDVPRNIGLLFFSQDPEKWFSGVRIEVVEFMQGADGDELREKIFKARPIQEQLQECIAYLEGLIVRSIEKLPQPKALHWANYPPGAFREALCNAIYHRSYDGEPKPIKVYIYPDRMEIISYPGPVPGIELKHLNGLAPLPPVPARNRRIGEFLKELKLAEGRGTGMPKIRHAMQRNGSPPPQFDFDEIRSYFRVTLPIHPRDRATGKFNNGN